MKKKHIVLILSTLFIIVLAVFFIDLPTATVGEPVEFDFDVIDTDIVIKLNKKAITNKSASFMVLNNKKFEIATILRKGYKNFELFKEKDGKWHNVNEISSSDGNGAPAIVIFPIGEQTSFSIDFESILGILQKGKYLLIKSFYESGQDLVNRHEYVACCEFEV